MYFISGLIRTKSSKNLFVKVVHPGGRVEIHDRPIVAAEVLTRHPKCCVANCNVFRSPYSVVAPSATLVLGQKYYVVPVRTVRRLQLQNQTNEREAGVKNEGTRLSVKQFDQWQPGLDSIKEE